MEKLNFMIVDMDSQDMTESETLDGACWGCAVCAACAACLSCILCATCGICAIPLVGQALLGAVAANVGISVTGSVAGATTTAAVGIAVNS